jgi:hypothetical protein
MCDAIVSVGAPARQRACERRFDQPLDFHLLPQPRHGLR